MIKFALVADKRGGTFTCRDYGMVVGDFGVVEYTFGFGNGPGKNWRCLVGIRSHPPQNVGNFGVDVFREIGGVDTRICSHFLFVKRLDERKRSVGRPSPKLVGLDLQGC